MRIQTIVTGQLQTNCYIVTCPDTNKCIIIDPGDGADVISEQILTQNLNPQLVVATHGHFDHILAAFELQTAFEIPFLMHKDDEFLLPRMRKSAKHWTGIDPQVPPPKVDKTIDESDTITFGNSELKILHTPGHTPGSICLYNEKEKVAFTGDTIFNIGVGRTDFSYSNTQQLQNSIKNIKKQFKGFKIFPGHENDLTI